MFDSFLANFLNHASVDQIEMLDMSLKEFSILPKQKTMFEDFDSLSAFLPNKSTDVDLTFNTSEAHLNDINNLHVKGMQKSYPIKRKLL